MLDFSSVIIDNQGRAAPHHARRMPPPYNRYPQNDNPISSALPEFIVLEMEGRRSMPCSASGCSTRRLYEWAQRAHRRAVCVFLITGRSVLTRGRRPANA